MREELFNDLLQSIQQMDAIVNGLDAHTAHADEVAQPSLSELGVDGTLDKEEIQRKLVESLQDFQSKSIYDTISMSKEDWEEVREAYVQVISMGWDDIENALRGDSFVAPLKRYGV